MSTYEQPPTDETEVVSGHVRGMPDDDGWPAEVPLAAVTAGVPVGPDDVAAPLTAALRRSGAWSEVFAEQAGRGS